MPSIGPFEILVVGVIALLVFGPERLPQIARSFGRALNEFRRQAGDIRAEFESSFDDEEEDDEPSPRSKPVVHKPDPKPLPTAEGVDPADSSATGDRADPSSPTDSAD